MEVTKWLKPSVKRVASVARICVELLDQTGDLGRCGDEVADKPLYIADQTLLIGDEGRTVRSAQFDCATQAGHEGTRVLGEVGEHFREVPEQQRDLAGIGLSVTCKLRQRSKSCANIREGYGLQGAVRRCTTK